MYHSIKFQKKNILALTEGHIIISNTIRADGFPTVCEYVSPIAEREEQWLRISQIAANRSGIVLEDEKLFLQHLKVCIHHSYQYSAREDVHPLEHKLRLLAYEKKIAPYPVHPCFSDLLPLGVVNILVHPEKQTAEVMYACMDRTTGEFRIVKTQNEGIAQGDGSFDFTPVKVI